MISLSLLTRERSLLRGIIQMIAEKLASPLTRILDSDLKKGCRHDFKVLLAPQGRQEDENLHREGTR